MAVKKLLCLFAALLLLPLCGCGDQIELKDRMIVQAIGFDWADGLYTVTVQFFSHADSGGQTGLTAGESNSRTTSGSGETVSEALRSIATARGKEIFYGKNNILVIGPSVVGTELKDLIDFLCNDYRGRINNLVFSSDSTAGTVLAAELRGSVVSAEVIEYISDINEKLSVCPQIRLFDLQEAVYGAGETAVLPCLHVESAEDSEQTGDALRITGLTVYRAFAPVGLLDLEMCKAYMMLRGSRVYALETVETAEYGRVSVTVERASSSLRCLSDSALPHFSFRLHLTVRITEISETARLTGNDRAYLAAVQEALCSRLSDRLDAFFQLTGRQLYADPAGLCELLSRSDQARWAVWREKPLAYLSGASLDSEFDIIVSDPALRMD